MEGGGLIRSHGSWAEIARRIKQGERLKGDARILGDSDFVTRILKTAREDLEQKYFLKAQGIGFDSVIRYVAKLFSLKPEELRGSRKYPHVVQARSLLCYWLVEEVGEKAAAVARKLSLSQAGVSAAVKRGKILAQNRRIPFPFRRM